MSEFIQIHALTSYPPSNLNRDDMGRPKTAMFGGAQRLRISSQSLKRAWRTSDVFVAHVGEPLVGTRTKSIGDHVVQRLVAGGVDAKAAMKVGLQVARVFGKVKEGEGPEKPKKDAKAADPKVRAEQLAHFSAEEKTAIDGLIARVLSGESVAPEEYPRLLRSGRGSPDIALFGRMLADSPSNNIDAAAQVAHAITVHRVTVEDDYFTAVDDLNSGEEDLGAGHIGTTEFAAGVFYLYVCVNRTLLAENLAGDDALVGRTLQGLLDAIAKVSPSGKQNSFGSRARASYVMVERGQEQPRSLSVAFLQPVVGGDLLAGAIGSLQAARSRLEAAYGPGARESLAMDAHAGTGTFAELLEFIGRRE